MCEGRLAPPSPPAQVDEPWSPTYTFDFTNDADACADRKMLLEVAVPSSGGPTKHEVLGTLRPTVGNTVGLTTRFSGSYSMKVRFRAKREYLESV